MSTNRTWWDSVADTFSWGTIAKGHTGGTLSQSNIDYAMKLLEHFQIDSAVSPETVRGIPAYQYCKNDISSTIAGNPKGLYKHTGHGREKVTDHPLHYLISQRPSKYLSQIEFDKTMEGQCIDYGNSFAKINRNLSGMPTDMEIWHPRRVRVWMDDELGRKLYKNVHTGETVDYMDVLHYTEDMNDPELLVAESKTSVHRKALESVLLSREMYNKVMKKGTFLSGFLKFAKPFRNKEQLQEAIDAWNTTYGGYANAGSTAGLENGGEYVQLKVPFRELQFIEQMEMSVAEVGYMLSYKPGQLGVNKGESFSTLEQYSKEKMQSIIIPRARQREQEQNYKLLPQRMKGEYYFKTNFKGMLQGSIKDRNEFYTNMIDRAVMTPNHVLELEDMNTFPDGDIRVMPMHYTTLDNIKEGKPASLFPNDETNNDE